ncbi:hypothetical protein Tco_0508215 [Tanacetum coccineum]
MNELVNDGIKLSMFEINTGFINGLLKKWLAFCQSLENTNHVKESELASLFGKLKYEENLIDSIYETNKEKTLVSTTPLSIAFISTSIVKDFQDSSDEEEDVRRSREYMNDLEEEYQARALLAKSKRFFKNVILRQKPRVSLMKHMNRIKKKCHQMKKLKSKLLWHLLMKKESPLENKVPAMVNGLRSLYKSEQIPTQKKKILGINQLTKDTSSSSLKDLIFVKSSADNSNMSITSSNKPRLSEAEHSTVPNHDTYKVPSDELERNMTDPSVAIFDSSMTDYDSAGESSVCSTPLHLLEKFDGAEPIFRPKTIKLILKSNSTFKAKILKSVIINEPSSAPAKGMSASMKVCQHHTGQGESSSRSRYSMKREARQAKKAETLKTSKIESLSSLRSKTPTKRFSAHMEDDVDISVLTIEQYIALIPDDIKPGIVNPKIGDDIMDLFHFPGVTHDAIMLRVFPMTLKGRALRWKDRLPERYNDLLYQYSLHNLTYQQKVHIFYPGLDVPAHKILDSNGFIPLMTPIQALESIHVMADHFHNWYDETTTRERINDVLNNIDAIHKSFKGEHLTKECSLKKENEAIKHSRYMESLEETIVPRDLPPMPFLGHLKEQMGSPYRIHETVHMSGNPEEIHNEKAQEDEGDMDVDWDIISKDVERMRIQELGGIYRERLDS